MFSTAIMESIESTSSSASSTNSAAWSNKTITTDLGAIHLESRLGSGTFGSVYVSSSEGFHFAVKVVSCQTDHEVQAYQQELEVLNRLKQQPHKNIVPIMGFAKSALGLGLFLFRLAPHGSLQGMCANGPLTVTHALGLFDQILGGLAFLHSLGIFHRDVKPDNVLMLDAFNCQLTDFGLAYYSNQPGVNPVFQQGAGTEPFLPPEFYDFGMYLGDRGDLWAAAITLVYMATGRLPWDRASRNQDWSFSIYAQRSIDHLLEAWAPLQSHGNLLHEVIYMLHPNSENRIFPNSYCAALMSSGIR